jgi:hypothetical protein
MKKLIDKIKNMDHADRLELFGLTLIISFTIFGIVANNYSHRRVHEAEELQCSTQMQKLIEADNEKAR